MAPVAFPLLVIAAGLLTALSTLPSLAHRGAPLRALLRRVAAPECLRRIGLCQVALAAVASLLTMAAWPTAIALGFPPETGVPGWAETAVGLESALFAWLAGWHYGRVPQRTARTRAIA